MKILGLNAGEINTSAALSIEGSIVAGVAEERFNREKRTKNFPDKSIQYCLNHAGIKFEDLDFIAQSWNPSVYWRKYNPLISQFRNRREDYFYTIPDNLMKATNRKENDWVKMSMPEEGNFPPLYFVTHHRSHSAASFFLSEFEEAAILTADWKGEFESTTMGKGKGNMIEIFQTQEMPNSLGMLYASFTELLGYRPDSDEWKVMALSSFDVNYMEVYDKIKSTIQIDDSGRLTLDQSYYQGGYTKMPKLYSEKLVDLLGGNEGKPGEEPTEWHLSIAKAMQHVSEDIATALLVKLYDLTKCNNLVLGGGFFMNSVFNGKVTDLSPFKNLYVPYAPGDLGNSVGAALYVSHCLMDEDREYKFNSSFIGPDFSDEEIIKVLKRRRISYNKLENPAETVAQILSDGEIVAHYAGRLEFGERALGNRSILADPRGIDTKDKINTIIKYRETYRPFAPAVISDRASQYFEVPSDYDCHFMEKVRQIRPEYHSELPAVTHVDGSGRLQTVSPEHNRRFYDILNEFEKKSGYPIVLNTSFNIKGEPIVLSPDDALNTFYNSGLKYLVMGNFLVKKD